MQTSFFLPQDIFINILSRLPAKSIGQCRCVSKPWRALLLQPRFIKTHLEFSRKIQQQSLIFLSDSGSLYSVSLGNAHQLFDEITEPATKLIFAGHPNSWTWVIASCDGLVLVRNKEGNKFLINPVTRDIRQVPSSPFAQDPSVSSTVYGLGYDSINDDYKIATLSYFNPKAKIFVNVYSVKNDSWKKVENSPSPYDHIVGYTTSGVSVDGYIHWIASLTSYGVIVTFDLAQEMFYEVPPPSSISKFAFYSFVAIGGCLCMFHTISNSETLSDITHVWMKKEYGNKDSWTNFTIIDTKVANFKPLCLLSEGQMVLVKNEWKTDDKLVKYNLENGTFKDLVVHGILDGFHAKGAFIDSLVSPHCSYEHARKD